MSHAPRPIGTMAVASAMSFGLATAAIGPASAHGAVPEAVSPSFNRVSTVPAYLNTDIGQESVAEISSVTADGNTVVYTDAASEGIGFVDISDPSNATPDGFFDLPGEPTSVYVADTPTGEYILAVVNTSESYTNPSGVVVVLDAATREQVGEFDLGGQPDSIDVNPDGTQAVIAIENERDEEATPEGGEEGDLPQLPAGHVVTIDLTAPVAEWEPQIIDMTGLAGIDTPEDPEPEYVKYSPNGEKIAVTLQENNAVAILDAATGEIASHFSAGEATVEGVDTADDGRIELAGSITAPREPDAIGWVDDDHVATADEGDWKGGTRGWTVFDAASGEITWTAGNLMDKLAVTLGHYPDKRSEKKGTEPEGLAIETFNGTRYAFVASERGNFVAIHDVTNPAEPTFVQAVPSTMGPEGLLPIPERNLLVVSSEEDSAEDGVRATVQTYELSDAPASYPEIAADLADPIAWNALGSLTADPTDPNRLWTASDDALAPTRILEIDNSGRPASIVGETPVTLNGEQTNFDVEGLWRKPDGGFWLAVEGDPAKHRMNQIVEVNDAGEVLRTMPIPAEATALIDKYGIEGITGTPAGDKLWVTFQRELEGEDFVRIAQVDPATGEFTWFSYTVTDSDDDGWDDGWVGLSEITYIDEHTLAVIERDNQVGTAAAIKRVYYVQGIDDPGSFDAPTPLTKELAVDVLPRLGDTNGWVQEKLEGLTVDADGDLWAITDNDGVDDNSGETRFMNLGDAQELNPFGPRPSPTEPAPSEPGPSEPTPTEPGPSEPGPGDPAPTDPADPTDPGREPGGRLPETGAGVGAGVLGAAVTAALAGIGILRRR